MISKGKNMISIKRYDGLERATSQCLRNERIYTRSLGRKNGEEKTTSPTNELGNPPYKEWLMEKSTTKRISSKWAYGKHLKIKR